MNSWTRLFGLAAGISLVLAGAGAFAENGAGEAATLVEASELAEPADFVDSEAIAGPVEIAEPVEIAQTVEAEAAPDAIEPEAMDAVDDASRVVELDMAGDEGPIAFDPLDADVLAGYAMGVDPLGFDVDPMATELERVAEADLAEETAPMLPGQPAIDEHGHKGHVHIVISGDTLWDISNSYLGTPWVWPAIWSDNREIENPHLIVPGDRIWISSTEMRSVSAAEADSFVENGAKRSDEIEWISQPAAPDFSGEDVLAVVEDEPAAREDEEVSLAVSTTVAGPVAGPKVTIHVPGRDGVSFVTAEVIDAATSIVESPSARTFLCQGDEIYLGLGEGETQLGAEYTIFTKAELVRDPNSGIGYGHHIEVLGWAEIVKVGSEMSVALIRESSAEISRGDPLILREKISPDVVLKDAPSDLDGQIIWMPNSRANAGQIDFVYLDRGAMHGLEVGSAVEVYHPSAPGVDRVRSTRVTVPAVNIADLVVVSVQPDSSVAFVMHSRRELALGDLVRAGKLSELVALR